MFKLILLFAAVFAAATADSTSTGIVRSTMPLTTMSSGMPMMSAYNGYSGVYPGMHYGAYSPYTAYNYPNYYPYSSNYVRSWPNYPYMQTY